MIGKVRRTGGEVQKVEGRRRKAVPTCLGGGYQPSSTVLVTNA